MDTPNSPNHPVLVEDLTERELDVLRLKAQNRSNQEIADELVLAVSTVKWYVRQVYGKLGVQNRRQAVARAQALGIIEGQPTSSFRPHHNLPAQTTPFIGREQECADLDTLLADPEVRLVTILAPGGMGKTRLGLAVAEAHLARFADGVYMVPLAPLRSPDQIVTAIADATHFPFMPDERSPKQQMLDFLRHKHMLLLLDNFEHLLDGAGIVTEILHVAPAVQVVVTSRERLNLSGETVYTVGGMTFPDWETPDDALLYDAVRLFMQRAELACPGFELHQDDLRFLARICRLVEGMPLGIVLAAAWTEVLSLEEIADEIQDSFDFLAAEMRDMPRRQWSIRAVFEPTWNRLTDSERDAFMRFSVFRGGCTRDAVRAVTGANLRTLQGLINKALVDRDSSGRYQMHELLRQYAAQQLEAAGQTEAAYDAHCAHFMDFLAEREEDVKGRRQLAALDEIDADYENVRIAWLWATEKRDYEALWRASLCLWLMTHNRRWFGTLEQRLELFQQVRQQFGPHDEGLPPIAIRVLWWTTSYGDDEEAIARIGTRCLAIARQYNDPTLLAEAQCYYGQSLALGSRDWDGALEVLEDCLARWQAMDAPYWIAKACNAIAVTCANMGDAERADAYTRQVMTIHRASGNKIALAINTANLGRGAALSSGDYSEGKCLLREALALSEEMNVLTLVAYYTEELGEFHFYTGDFEQARTLVETALRIAKDLNLAVAQIDSLDALATLASVEGDYQTAQQLCEQSAALVPERISLDRPYLPSLGLSILAYHRTDYEATRRHLHVRLEWLSRCSYYSLCAAVLPVAALVRGHTGDQPGAAELLSLAFTHPKSPTGWLERWPLLVEFCADLEADLGSDAYHATWERGATLDLETVIAELLEEFAE